LEEIDAAQKEFTTEQKSRSGVIITIDHDGDPAFHCGLVERGANGRFDTAAPPRKAREGSLPRSWKISPFNEPLRCEPSSPPDPTSLSSL
jgi:hypothetical protein